MSEQQSTWRQPPPTAGDESGSTRDKARAEAGNVAHVAADRGGDVADNAREQGGRVVSEATHQLRDLTDQARSQVAEQAGAQQRRAADGLRRLSDELNAMSDSGTGGTAQQLVRSAAEQVERVAGWLDGRDTEGLVNDVRGFARRHPGTFLLAAGAAGVIAGRATRSGVEVARSDDDTTSAAAPGVPPQASAPAVPPQTPAPPPGTPYATGQPTDVMDPGASQPSPYDQPVQPTGPVDPATQQGRYR